MKILIWLGQQRSPA